MKSCQVSALLLAIATASAAAHSSASEKAEPRRGSVEFVCPEGEASLPEQFRLNPHTFDFEQTPVSTSARTISLSTVTFPSPVVTPHPQNNTVHCEYFRPKAGGVKRPGVVVLHILGGDFDLSRLFCRALADRGVAALFMKMPYYGERRQPGSPARMISIDPVETVRGMTQAVLDARQAAAWLARKRKSTRGSWASWASAWAASPARWRRASSRGLPRSA